MQLTGVLDVNDQNCGPMGNCRCSRKTEGKKEPHSAAEKGTYYRNVCTPHELAKKRMPEVGWSMTYVSSHPVVINHIMKKMDEFCNSSKISTVNGQSQHKMRAFITPKKFNKKKFFEVTKKLSTPTLPPPPD